MKVILLQDVPKLGSRYQVAEVAKGYALNFLIPKKLALFATEDALARIEQLQKKNEATREAEDTALQETLKNIDGQSVSFALSANEKGGLFAALTPEEVLEALNERFGTNFSSAHVVVPHIKEVGKHEARLTVGEKHATVTIDVSGEAA